MSTNQSNGPPITQNKHADLERSLIETYLKSRGYTRADLKKLPEAQARQLMKEACIYASGKLAELEKRAQFLQELHNAYHGED
jgi:hypothetical protein